MSSSSYQDHHQKHADKQAELFGLDFANLLGTAEKTKTTFKLPYGVKEVCYNGNLCVVYFMAKS